MRTTVGDAKVPCPIDRVNRQFRAERPNQPWGSDFTHVSAWQGWLYVAFVVDVFARRIADTHLAADLLDAHVRLRSLQGKAHPI